MRMYKDGKVTVVPEEEAKKIRERFNRFLRRNTQDNSEIKELKDKIADLEAKLAESKQ